MKLIMESWKRFLNEERPVIDPRLLPALAQDAMEVVAANPGMDAASITLATMAKAGSELPLIDMEKVATITLGDLFDEVGLQNIMQGAAEFAGDEAPPPGGGQWASPDISDEEDTLQEDDDDAMRGAERPGPDIEGYPNPEEEEDPMASQLGTEKQQLLSRILARAVVDRYASPAEIEHGLGLEMTPEMTHFIQYLQANPMFGSSGMEESSQSGSTQGRGSPGARSESGFAQGTRSRRAGGPKKRAKKTTSKTDRASSKRELKK
jgi:hypothetical protein